VNLIPFDPRFAESVLSYYLDPAYSHWARGPRRFLTLEECRHLPEFFGSEFLHILKEGVLIGLVRFHEEGIGVFNVSLILNKDLHGKKLAQPCMDLIEGYADKVKGARMVMAEFLTKDFWLCDGVEKRGWSKAGEIPEYNFVDGNYENISIFYKKLR